MCNLSCRLCMVVYMDNSSEDCPWYTMAIYVYRGWQLQQQPLPLLDSAVEK